MARAIGKTRIAQVAPRPPRQRPRCRAAVSTTGTTTPAHGQTGATRFRGVTKISSSIPAAAARRARSIGNGQTGKNAKSQKRYIVVYGLTSAADARYETEKLASQLIPITAPNRGVARSSSRAGSQNQRRPAARDDERRRKRKPRAQRSASDASMAAPRASKTGFPSGIESPPG